MSIYTNIEIKKWHTGRNGRGQVLEEIRMFKKYDLKNHRRLIAFLLIVICLGSIYYHYSVASWNWYANEKSNGQSHPCMTPSNEMDDLKELIRDVNEVLDGLKLTHVLIYGSLWGALRYNNPLPWDNDLDMALMYDEVKEIDVADFVRAFHKKNINIYYRLWHGTYRVQRDTARGDLMVFRKTIFDNMCRTGIETWLFFINHKQFHTFPASLMEKPLPVTLFAGVNISIPRSGIEIQKHFYPHDWWREMKPVGC